MGSDVHVIGFCIQGQTDQNNRQKLCSVNIEVDNVQNPFLMRVVFYQCLVTVSFNGPQS